MSSRNESRINPSSGWSKSLFSWVINKYRLAKNNRKSVVFLLSFRQSEEIISLRLANWESDSASFLSSTKWSCPSFFGWILWSWLARSFLDRISKTWRASSLVSYKTFCLITSPLTTKTPFQMAIKRVVRAGWKKKTLRQVLGKS